MFIIPAELRCAYCFLQVETIGDAYMVVSGVPERSKYHAEHVADMALNMMKSMHELSDPSKTEENLKIRIGQFCLLELGPKRSRLGEGKMVACLDFGCCVALTLLAHFKLKTVATLQLSII